MRHPGAHQDRDQPPPVDNLDRFGNRIAFQGILIGSGARLQCLVRCIPLHRRHALIRRPSAHRPHARNARAHRRPQIPMIACGEDSAAAVHPLGQQFEFDRIKGMERVVVDIARIVRRIVAEEPDLVPIVQAEVRLRKPEAKNLEARCVTDGVIRVRVQRRQDVLPVVPSDHLDVEARPPRERVIAQCFEDVAQTEVRRIFMRADSCVDHKEDAEGRRPQRRPWRDTPPGKPGRQLDFRRPRSWPSGLHCFASCPETANGSA